MSALLLALALLTADEPAAPAEPEAPSRPAGAPADDYGLVAWCYGALRGYLDLHDQVMPEVTRIESTYRRPGSKLSDDLAVYGQMQKQGKASLATFARAMESAERASLKPLNIQGAAYVQKGRSVWSAASNVSKARLAQEWMSWTLPAACETTAADLETKAKLAGASLKVNAEPDPAPEPVTPTP